MNFEKGLLTLILIMCIIVAYYTKSIVRYIFLRGGVFVKKKGIGFYFKRIDEIMSMAANAHLKKYDITCSQANILFYMLEKGKNVVMQKEIEQEFGLRHSTIIGLLKRMEKNNFVRVEVNPEDHRCRQVILFDKAFELGSEMKEHRKYMDSLITGALNDEEEKELKKLLTKVYEHMYQDNDKCEK